MNYLLLLWRKREGYLHMTVTSGRIWRGQYCRMFLVLLPRKCVCILFNTSEYVLFLDLMDILGFGEQGFVFQAKFAREWEILLNANTVSNSSKNFTVNWENKKWGSKRPHATWHHGIKWSKYWEGMMGSMENVNEKPERYWDIWETQESPRHHLETLIRSTVVKKIKKKKTWLTQIRKKRKESGKTSKRVDESKF